MTEPARDPSAALQPAPRHRRGELLGAAVLIFVAWNLIAWLRVRVVIPLDYTAQARANAIRVIVLDENSWAFVAIASFLFARWLVHHGHKGVIAVASSIAVASVLIVVRYTVAFAVCFAYGWIGRPPSVEGFLRAMPNNLVFTLGLMGCSAAWMLYRQASERSAAESRLLAELAEARLQALRLQLNPHFLFNALNTIAGLVHRAPSRADRAIIALSHLLRVALSRSGPEISVREEREALEAYLTIERLRFGDWLTLSIELPATLDNYAVPPLILQPLVENAVRHGIAPREEPGAVSIGGRVHEESLELWVRDDGIGYSAANPDGIGLTNVRQRLRQLYGEAGSLSIEPAPPRGTVVRVVMPLRRVVPTSWNAPVGALMTDASVAPRNTTSAHDAA